MKKILFKNGSWVLFILFSLVNIKYADAQRTYASSQATGATGLLCVNCTVTNPTNAADGNTQTYSVLRVTVGLLAATYEDLIFSGTKPAGGTPVTIKFGSGDNLLSLTALGGVTFRAYNGNTPVGAAVAANTLISALSNNNQEELIITPAQTYDRVRVTLNGGLLGALSSIYLYDAFYGNATGACGTAIDELHGVSAGLLNLGADVGGVENPQLAIDGDITTASTLNAGVNLLGAYAQQTVIYSNQSVIGDSVRLTLSIPSSLITANVLSNISVATYNGNASNNDLTQINSALLSVQILDLSNNRQKMTFTFVPTKVFDRVQLRLGGIANVLSSLDFYEAQRFIPSPVIKINGVVTNSVQLCGSGTATLVATAVANTVFKWYSAASGGSAIFTGASFTTPTLTATKTYYVAAMRDGCTDESQRVPVTVTVNPIPATPVVNNSSVTVCSGQAATFTAESVSGVTVNWYTAATGGTLVATGNSFTTDPLTATTSYYAEAVSGGSCISAARKKVTATVSTPPVAPTLAANNVSICDGSVASLSVSAPAAGVSYNWYSAATGGTLLYTGNNFTTPVLHSNATYYVEAINAGGCISAAPRTQATVTVVPTPADPVLAANNSTISAGETATIAVTNTQTGITYSWYSSATANTSIYTGTTYTTPALFSTTTYYVSAVNTTGCTSADRTPITITVMVDDAPCSFANAQTSNVNGLCIGCGITNNTLSIDADTTTASTINVLAGLAGAYAEQELRFQQPGFAGDTIKIGLGSTGGLLSATVLGQIEVRLYNGATLVSTTALNSSTLTLSLLGGGANRYVAYIPATGVYDRVTVRVNSGLVGLLTNLNIYYATQQFPQPIFDPVNPEICKGSTAQINITSPGNGTFKWYTTPTGGASVHTGASYTTPALNANTTYYVEYIRGTCTSPVRYAIPVLVTDDPDAPVITTQNVTVNSGQPATLNATANNGATIQWFTTATGGTAVATGNTYTTGPLNANTTYYAEAASGSCVSATRTPVTVAVQAIVIPNVAVTPPTKAVDAGESATFTATSTTPGAVFNWFTTPTGGTSIFTGATFTTPAQFANTTYYAEASVPGTGAVSASRATGVVTVNTTGVNPVSCDAAIDQTNDISSVLCVGCGINNATGSVDNDRNTFSRLNVPVGLVAYSQQTLRFANTGIAGDSIIVELGIPGSLASVNVLSGISIATYNGATYNNDRFNINGSTINISLLSGTSRFRIAFKASNAFDRVEVRLNASLASVLSSLNIYDAVQEVAAPVISASAATVCSGSQATLTATVPANVTVKWYTSATGGSPVFTGAVFTTPALSTTTTYYAEASRTADGCAQAVRMPATVTVVPVPVAPVVPAANLTVCSGQPVTFAATPVSGVTFNWYATPSGGTSLHTGNNFTTPALTATTSYYVEASNAGNCNSSARTKVTATVTATPANATVNPATVTTCAGSPAVLTAMSAEPGVTFNWYTAATGGTPVFTGSQFTTPNLTANTSYYVEVSNGSCVSANRTIANVVVNPLPANPTVVVTPTGANITSGQTATIAASSTTANVTFNWYSTASGGSPIFTGASFITPPLSGNATYYVEAASNTTDCVSAARTPVTITVNPIFSTSCDFASTQTFDVNGGLACIGCTVTDPNNAVDADTTSFSQLVLPVSVAGYVGQKLIFSDNGAAGDTVSVKIEVPASLLSAGVLNQIQIASYNGATYNGDRIALSSSAIKLQLLAGGQIALIKFVPQATYDAVEIRVASTVSVFNSLNIYFASKQVPTPQLNPQDKTVNICAGSTATFTLINTHADVTYKWYTTVTGGASVHTGTSFTTGALSVTTTYYVEASRTSNGCVNPNRVAVIVNVTPTPVTPVLLQNTVEICAGDQVKLSVTNAGTAAINWYSAATGGTLLFTGPDFIVSPIVTTNYYAEATNGTCTSSVRKTATVTVNPRPAAPGLASNDVQVCSGSPAILSIVSPAVGVNYQWFTTATGGAAVHTGSNFTTPALTADRKYYVQAVNTTSLCANNGGRTVVNIMVTPPVAAPVLSATTTSVCNGGSATISVKNPVTGITYTWFSAATGGTAIFTGTTYTANNLTANVSYYVEAANSTGCTSAARKKTTITVKPLPATPQVTATAGSLTICTGSSTSLNIVSPQAGVVYNWYNAAIGGTLLYTGTQFNTPVLTANTTYYVEASEAGNCNSSARRAVTVTVTALPGNPALVNAAVTVCSGSAATFTVSSPQAGVTYQWFDSPSQNNKLFEGSTYVSGLLTVTTKFYVQGVNATGCVSTNRTTATATVVPVPGVPVLTQNNVDICLGDAATLSVTNGSGATVNWYSTATGGTLLFTGANYHVSPTATKTYYVEITNGTCSSSSRKAATVTVNSHPAAPVLIAGNVQVCSGSTATFSVASPANGLTYQWFTAATGGTSVHTGATFTTPSLTQTSTYYVEAVNASSCSSTSRTTATATVTPLPPVPVLAANNVQVCSGDPATLSVTNASGSTVNWYNTATGGTLLFTGANYVVSPAATTTYYAEITNGTCTSPGRKAATVTVGAHPAAPALASNNAQICSGSSAVFNIVNPENGVTYQWFTTATGGTAVHTGATFTSPQLTQSRKYYVEAINTTSQCTNTGGRVVANVTVSGSVAAPTLSATTTTVCSGASVSLSVTNPIAGLQYNWYTVATGGTPIFTGTTYTASNLTANVSYYVEAANSTGCASATRTQTTVNVQPVPNAPQVKANAGGLTVCMGSPASLGIVSPQAGVVYTWYNAATGGTVVHTGTVFNTPALTANTTYYVGASQGGNCNSSARTAVTIEVAATPTDPALTLANVNVCSGSNATFKVASPQAGITYQWFDSASQVNKLFEGTTYISGPVTTTTRFYVAAVNATGCRSANLVMATATVQAPPSAPAVVNGSTINICMNTNVTLNIENPQSGYTYKWYTSAAGTTVVYTGASFTTPRLSSNTLYFVSAINATGCESASRTGVPIAMAQTPSAPSVTAPDAALCPGTTAILKATAIGGMTVQWFTSATGGTAVHTGATFDTPALNATTTYFAETVNAGGCSSPLRTAAVVQVLKPLDAPIVTVAETTATTVSFKWDAVPSAAAYQISTDKGLTFSAASIARTYTASGLQPLQSINLIVRALATTDCQISANSLAVVGTTTNPQGNQIFIPNAFSPNGDGNNDIFLAYGTTIQNMTMSIYDQWGGMLFRSTTQGSGWDGTYKGRAQPVGTYVYYIEATLADGQKITRKGTINLLR